MNTIVVRRAVPGEARELTAVAFESKRHWAYPEAWIALWTDVLKVTPAFVAANDVFVAESDGAIEGFYALALERGGWELAHLWVRPAHMGHGVGRRLFEHAAARLGERAPGARMRIEADPHAEAFYLRMGARRVGEITRDWQGLTRTIPELEF